MPTTSHLPSELTSMALPASAPSPVPAHWSIISQEPMIAGAAGGAGGGSGDFGSGGARGEAGINGGASTPSGWLIAMGNPALQKSSASSTAYSLDGILVPQREEVDSRPCTVGKLPQEATVPKLGVIPCSDVASGYGPKFASPSSVHACAASAAAYGCTPNCTQRSTVRSYELMRPSPTVRPSHVSEAPKIRPVEFIASSTSEACGPVLLTSIICMLASVVTAATSRHSNIASGAMPRLPRGVRSSSKHVYESSCPSSCACCTRRCMRTNSWTSK
mmetsp:Transcript_82132/g.163598  ORF Transcript_82132/g.163598 Transcript_82132/m.163598 type:complete len:275 (+) Transcript_82132:3967-4791(+)